MEFVNYFAIPSYGSFGPTSTQSHTLNASNSKIAFLGRVLKTGSIPGALFRTSNVTTSNALTISLQNTSGADPDGTQDQSASQASVASNTWYEVAFGSARSVTRGEKLAMVIEFSSWTTGNLQIASLGSGVWAKGGDVDYAATGTYVRQNRIPIGALRYDDGTIGILDGWASCIPNSASVGNASTPDERALRFSVPFPCKVGGFVGFYGNAGDADIVLYDTDGTTELAVASLDAAFSAASSGQSAMGMFASDVELTPGGIYRLAHRPSTSTTMTQYYWDYPNTAAMSDIPGGSDWNYSERTNGGSWTNTSTRRFPLFPRFSAFSDGTGGGGLMLPVGMEGGF